MRFVYFDTDALRHMGNAFATAPLSEELRDRIVLSPITVLELFSQLTLPGPAGREISSVVRALPNSVNRQSVGLLPWWTSAVRGLLEKADEDLAKEVQEALNVCLNSNSFDEIQADAGKLKDILDRERERQRRNFEELVRMYKKCVVEDRSKFKDVCAGAIAGRVGTETSSGSLGETFDGLSAHIEYQEERVKLAANNPKCKPRKNDYFDALQLVYLVDPQMHFLTCDPGYPKRIKCSPQLSRIHRVSVLQLTDATQAQQVLRKIVLTTK